MECTARAPSESLTCSVEDFARLVGVTVTQANAYVHGDNPPHGIWARSKSKQKRDAYLVIRSDIEPWLYRQSELQHKGDSMDNGIYTELSNDRHGG